MPSANTVVVVGSGAAGLAAALAARGAVAEVLLVEQAQAVGGTPALSVGSVWMPGHGRPSPTERRQRRRSLELPTRRGRPAVTLVRYQASRIRHFHATLADCLGA